MRSSSDHPSDRSSDDDAELLAEPATGQICAEVSASATDHADHARGMAPPTPSLRFLLHRDTPLWRFGH